MCNEMQLKSEIYWNTLRHKLAGFASDSSEMNLAKEIEAINNVVNDESTSSESCDSLDLNNSNAKKFNQWCFHSVKGVIHNVEFFQFR